MGLLDKAMGRKESEVSRPEKKEAGVEYKTNIDRVYFEVKKSKDISLLNLSKRLNIKKEQVEEYAEILNNQGLLDLYYTNFGSPRLKVKEIKKRLVLKKGNKLRNLLVFALILLIILIGGMYLYTNFLR